MKEENKKILLNLFVLAGFSLSIVSLFMPVTCFDFSDVYKNTGLEPLEVNYKRENYILLSLLVSHDSEYDYRISEKSPVYERYSFAFNINFEKGEPTGVFYKYEYYDHASENENILSHGSAERSFLTIVCRILFLVLFFYFILKGFKKIQNKSNRYLLYAGFIFMLGTIIMLILIYDSFRVADNLKLGYVDVLTFGYGFYLVVASVALFFISYLFQNHLLGIHRILHIRDIKK